MNIPLAKLKAIIVYFCHNTDSRFLGKTKLMKLFYFLDFLHVKKFGAPVTFDTYVHLEHGPIPSSIKNLVDSVGDDFENAVLADTITIERVPEINMQRIKCARPFTERDKKLFTKGELEVLDIVCKRFRTANRDTIVKASHEEAPWNQTDLLEEIPYSLATEDSDSIVSKEEVELLMQIEHGRPA